MSVRPEWDCIIVGAGPAGLSAALTLGRARRRVLVFDDDRPRNAAAERSHGVLGHDGIPVPDLRERGIKELDRYGVRVVETAVDPDRAQSVSGGVMLDGHTARTAMIASGLVEAVPQIDGFAEIYGRTAHTCPYCDGWEHRDQRIAVLAPHDGTSHMARLLTQWTDDVIVLADGASLSDAEQRAVEQAEIPVLTDPIARFVSSGGELTGVELADGTMIPRDALFFHIGCRPRTEIAVALGCETNDGGYLVVDEHRRQSTVDRVYAAGNCVNPKHNVPLAIADGVRAAVNINERLLEDDLCAGSGSSARASSH